jgi:hypothetical protein
MAKYDASKTVKEIRDADTPEKAKSILDKAVKQMAEQTSGDDIGSLDTVRIQKGREYYEILLSQAEALGDTNARIENQRILLIDQVAQQLRKNDATKDEAQIREDIKKILADEQVAIEDMNDEEKRKFDLLQDQLRIINSQSEGQKKYGKEINKMIDDLAEGLGITNFLSDSWLGSVIKVGKALSKGGKEGADALAYLTEKWNDTFNVTNLLASVVLKIVETTLAAANAADKAQAAFASATGAGRAFADSIQSAGQYSMGFGVSMEDAGKAAEGLFVGTTNFVNVSKDMQAQMIANTAELEKIGVSAQAAGEIFQFMNLNLGMTAQQALEATKELAVMGTELGISSQQMTKDFNQAMGSLAVYGPRAVGVFKNLSAAAKVAGVETSKLLSIAAKFDTFQGSAETVGKLNALLGTQLSTTQMLMQTEDERMETLIGTVQAQGTAFKDMDRFQQKAVAAAAGITDMNEAQRIFGMNLSQYGQYQEEMAASADAQEKLTEAIRGTQTITNKLKSIAAEFIVEFQPMLDLFHDVLKVTLDWLKTLSPETKRMIMGVVLAIASITLAMKILGPVMAATSAIMGVAGGAAAGGGVTFIGGLAAMGGAAAAAIVPLAKLAAILGVLYVGYKAVMGIGSLFEPGPEPSQAEKEAEGIIKYKSQMTPAVSADIANLALIASGRAKDAMTDAFVMAQKIDFKANFEGLFPETIQLVMDDGTKFNTYVAKITNH